jgi:hypothetical protein
VPLIKAIFLPSVALTSVDRADMYARLAVLKRCACTVACKFNSLYEGSASTCFLVQTRHLPIFLVAKLQVVNR